MDSSYLNKAFNRLIRKRHTLEEINGRETTLGCKLGGKTGPDQLKWQNTPAFKTNWAKSENVGSLHHWSGEEQLLETEV